MVEQISREENEKLDREIMRLLGLVAAKERKEFNYIESLYPGEGPLRRELYPKHMEFFSAGSRYRERCILAGNRTGKTEGIGGYELTMHLTGRYPDWWEGRRFKRAVKAWAAGDTGKTTRDILQAKLLGPIGSFGTGLIPKDAIVGKPQAKAGIAEAIEIIRVKHKSGGTSNLILKSYDQRREAFQGTEQDVIWLDEEPPLSIYTECLMRTMTTNGLIICTFTPLLGLSEVVLSFLPGGQMQAISPELKTPKYVVMATWDDCPHLTQEQKESLWASIPPHQRDARTKGIPQLGAGAIFPLPEEEITCEPFRIPDYWPKCYGMDVGWQCTAALWGAWDRESDIVYLWSEYKAGQAEPPIHAAAIKARGKLPGVIDPAARGRSQKDGEQLYELYQELGLDLSLADNAVEAGIYEVWQRLSTGRLKVFKTLTNWLSEYRIYRRDEKGKIVKENDHLMDCCVGPETLVCTDKGKIKISDLVGKTGYVISRSGSRQKFFGARKTLIDVPVVKVVFSDGSQIICTPDHPFLTPDGWIKSIDLKDCKCYNGVSQRIGGTPEWLRFIQKQLKNIKVSAITFVENIFNGMASVFTSGFGQMPMGQCPTVCASTTSTITEPTTTWQISCLSPKNNILHIINEDTQEVYQQKLLQPLPSGMGQKQARSGITSIMNNSSTLCTRSRNLSVNGAVNNIRLKSLVKIDSVPMPVKPSLVSHLVWTMRNGFAWFAAAFLWRIAMLRKKRAQESVVTNCLEVKDAGRSDVYCLTVPASHSFCIESGIVVHNTKYFVLSGLEVAEYAGEEEEYEPAPEYQGRSSVTGY